MGARPNGERAEGPPLTQTGNSIDQIAAWAGALEAGQVPPAAFALAKKAFLDTLAVSLSGSQLDSARIVSGLASELGQSGGPRSGIGHGGKADGLPPALAKGPAAPPRLVDGNNDPQMGHPPAPLWCG